MGWAVCCSDSLPLSGDRHPGGEAICMHRRGQPLLPETCQLRGGRSKSCFMEARTAPWMGEGDCPGASRASQPCCDPVRSQQCREHFWMLAGSSLIMQAVTPALPAQHRLSSLHSCLAAGASCWPWRCSPWLQGLSWKIKKPSTDNRGAPSLCSVARSNLGCLSALGVGREVWEFLNKRGCMAMALRLEKVPWHWDSGNL